MTQKFNQCAYREVYRPRRHTSLGYTFTNWERSRECTKDGKKCKEREIINSRGDRNPEKVFKSTERQTFQSELLGFVNVVKTKKERSRCKRQD